MPVHLGRGERRARLATRHHLAPAARCDDVVRLTDDLVALHATDPATVHLSAWARLRSGDVAATEKALYSDRSLVRLLGMRRTVFVVSAATAPVVQAACSRDIAVTQRRLLLKLLTEGGVPEPAAWLADVERSVLAALHARGEATAAELAADEPRLATSVIVARGKPYEARQNFTSRVLFQLAVDGHILRGRPRGSWISSQHRWVPLRSWLPDFAEPPVEEARAELVRRWLWAFGPAPVTDLRWWTGLGARPIAAALARVGAVEVSTDDGPAVVLPDDLDPTPDPGPWAAALPGLDPTPMGWQRRDWFLGPHAARVFDRTGNIGATVWWNGRVVGGWAQRRDGEVVHRLLEDIGAEGATAVAAAVAETAARLGGVRVTPRFPAPLDKELAAVSP
ncbi:MAG TPA: winged helix DNA-binding domain-containing protein [Pseudonocardiaceae bacterium]